MIITYIRSSSVGRYHWCPHAYFLEYILGIKTKTNQATDKGTVVHKILEVIGQSSIAQKQGEKSFINDELGEISSLLADNLPEIVNFVFGWYLRSGKYNLKPDHLYDCLAWTKKAITFKNGKFDPRNRDIVKLEQYFDIEINKPWAWYKYTLPNNEEISGNLRLKGTIDFITKLDDNTYEMIDWKTGKKYDWNKDKEKTYEDLQKDFQLRLYHYVLCQLYPEIENIYVTIFFINDGGPCTVIFDRKVDLPETEAIIRQEFETIKNDVKPELSIGRKCTAYCHHGKTEYFNSDLTICQYFHNEIERNGIEETMKKYCVDPTYSNIQNYGTGGGRSAK